LCLCLNLSRIYHFCHDERLTLEQDLYSDYLVVNQGQATATRLAALLEQQGSHGRQTRSLSGADYGAAQLGQVVKPFVQQMAHPDGVLLLDDTVEEKPYSQPNELISYHFDHTQGHSVKVINQLTALYQVRIPACLLAFIS
jgi:hypothetical protein